jgi:hypothetical protein
MYFEICVVTYCTFRGVILVRPAAVHTVISLQMEPGFDSSGRCRRGSRLSFSSRNGRGSSKLLRECYRLSKSPSPYRDTHHNWSSWPSNWRRSDGSPRGRRHPIRPMRKRASQVGSINQRKFRILVQSEPPFPLLPHPPNWQGICIPQNPHLC